MLFMFNINYFLSLIVIIEIYGGSLKFYRDALCLSAIFLLSFALRCSYFFCPFNHLCSLLRIQIEKIAG